MSDVFKRFVKRSFDAEVNMILHQFRSDGIAYADVYIDLSKNGLGHWKANGEPSDYVKDASEDYISEYILFRDVVSWKMEAHINDDGVWSISMNIKIVNDFLNIEKSFNRSTEDSNEIYGKISDILPPILEQCDLQQVQMDKWDMVKRQVLY